MMTSEAAGRRGDTWIEIGPCNYHLRDLAQHVKEGIRAAGGTPLSSTLCPFPTASPWARKACAPPS